MSTTGRELTKTLLFVAAAVLTMFVAIRTKPSVVNKQVVSSAAVGKPLFEELTNPAAVTGIEVLSFDEDFGNVRRFEIKQEREGEWIIPSKQGYPANAQSRVAEAATMFIDRKVLRVVTDTDHERYGVVEPKLGTNQRGAEGVGTLFKVRGAANGSEASLAELIIGNPVKNQSGQYYVRRPGKSAVYTVEIDPTKLSTKFTDWIDPTLLPFSFGDILNLELHNYTVRLTQDQTLQRDFNYIANVSMKPSSQQPPTLDWKLNELQVFRDGGMQPTNLETGETLNEERLNVLQSALAAIVIQDVERKAPQMAGRLRAGETPTMEDAQGMLPRGFVPYTPPDEPGQTFSAAGEVRINVQQGLQFRIMVGQFGKQDSSSLAKNASLERYLMIVPGLYEEAFAKPELEELPPADADMSENDRKNETTRITKANQRKEKDYQEKIQAAESGLKVLRERYSNWYYLVSDDVVRRLRIPRSELIKLTDEAVRQGYGVEAFRQLQDEFLQLRREAGK